jgi:hypothetical protein
VARKKQVKPSYPWPFSAPDRQHLCSEVWPHQQTFLSLCKQFPIVTTSGGVQQGKTRGLFLASVQHMLTADIPDHVERTGWIIVPTRDPYWHNIKPECEHVWGFAAEGGMILDKTEHPAKYVLRGVEGKDWTWWVRHADNPDTLRSSPVACIIGTEAALYKPEVFGLLKLRVAKSRGPIYLDSSPNGLNWYWKELIERARVEYDYRPTKQGLPPTRVERTENSDPSIAVVRGVPIEANRLTSGDLLTTMRANESSEVQRREYDGEFFASSGLCLFSFDPRRHITKRRMRDAFERSKGQWHVIEGIDYGFTDSTAKVTIAVNGNRYVVVDEYEKAGMSLSAHAAIWKADTWHDRVKWRYDDPSLPLARAELGEHGIGISPGNNDVEAGINKLNHLLETGRLLIMDHCIKLIDAIGTWQRNQKTGRPQHPRDVLAALRYPILTHSLLYDGRPVPSGFVESTGEVKWKLPDGTVVETTREAPETAEMWAEDGRVREIV